MCHARRPRQGFVCDGVALYSIGSGGVRKIAALAAKAWLVGFPGAGGNSAVTVLHAVVEILVRHSSQRLVVQACEA